MTITTSRLTNTVNIQGGSKQSTYLSFLLYITVILTSYFKNYVSHPRKEVDYLTNPPAFLSTHSPRISHITLLGGGETERSWQEYVMYICMYVCERDRVKTHHKATEISTAAKLHECQSRITFIPKIPSLHCGKCGRRREL